MQTLAFKSKRAEFIYGISFCLLLFLLRQVAPPAVVVSVAVFGGLAYLYLFRERFHGRWLKVLIALGVGILLGMAIFSIR